MGLFLQSNGILGHTMQLDYRAQRAVMEHVGGDGLADGVALAGPMGVNLGRFLAMANFALSPRRNRMPRV